MKICRYFLCSDAVPVVSHLETRVRFRRGPKTVPCGIVPGGEALIADIVAFTTHIAFK
jgi:hypothetical protein